MIWNLCAQALTDLLDQKLRSGLTGVGILVSMALFTALLGYGRAMRSTVNERVAGIEALREVKGVVNPSSVNLSDLGQLVDDSQEGASSEAASVELDSAMIAQIRSWAGVAHAVPAIRFPFTLHSNGRSAEVNGACFAGDQKASDEGVYLTEELIEELSPDRTGSEVQEVVAAYSLFDPDRARVGSLSPFESVVDTFDVAGSVQAERSLVTVGSRLYLPPSLCDSLYWAGAGGGTFVQYRLLGGYPGVNVLLDEREASSKVTQKLREVGLSVISAEDVTAEIDRLVFLVEIGLYLLAGLAFLISSLGLVNTILMNVTERTADIGLMRTVGARTRDVRFLFIIQGGVLGLVFGIAGIVVGTGIMDLAEYGINTHFSLDPAISIFDISGLAILALVGFSTISSALISIWPASKAADIEPAVAVRSRG